MTIHLKSGAHDSRVKGMCAMEAAAYIAGESHSDHPECVSPVIGHFLRSWNDTLPSDADRDRLLKPLLPVVLFTRTTEADEQRRAWMATDWLVRVNAPAWLDVAQLHDHAARLRALPALTSREIAMAVQDTIYAAGAAAWAAAWAATRAATRNAARAAARAAAGDLQPTVEHLQASAQQLVRDMAAVGTVTERCMLSDRLAEVLYA